MRSLAAAVTLYSTLSFSDAYARQPKYLSYPVPCTIETLAADNYVIALEQDTVERVIDGDTIVLQNRGHVRLTGINAPEIGEEYAEEATQMLETLLYEGPVILTRYQGERKRDIYQRSLLNLFSGGRFVNEELVAAGLAQECSYGEHRMYTERLKNAQQHAKKNHLGKWQE